jgi:pimeloyl-ACP methyl ester carboxylesterase
MNVNTAITAALFVEFVYNKWNANGQDTDLTGQEVTNLAGQPVCSGKTYKVTRTIYSNDLATDINPRRPVTEGYKTIGIFAVNTADPTDICISIRGTENVWEWIQDFKFLPIPFSPVPGGGYTEDGFTDMYLSFSFSPNPQQDFIGELGTLLPLGANVIVAGHSLGAALSTLLSLDLAVHSKANVASFTFASPRVGDLSFGNLFNHVVQNAYRVANRMDIVPKTPPPPLYFHVGDEVDLIPGPELKYDLACEHSIISYLHMLGLLPGATSQFDLSATCTTAPVAPAALPLNK